jgi:hypothetical protein
MQPWPSSTVLSCCMCQTEQIEFRWQISQAGRHMCCIAERERKRRRAGAIIRARYMFSFVDLPTAENYSRERASFSRVRDAKNKMKELLPILVDLFVNQSACPVIN